MADVISMATIAGNAVKLKRYEDILFPYMDTLDPVQGMKYSKELKYRPDDILMCSFPKCGTHWFENMTWKLKTFDGARPVDTLLEFGPSEVYETMETPRIICTHSKPSRLPTEHIKSGGKIGLILRNPKDAMVSFYYHMKNAVVFKNPQTWDEYFQSYISGLVPMGSYFDYIQQWEEFLQEKAGQQHIQIFYYEDFKTNLNDNIVRLNEFLGFNRDQGYIERVKEETTMSVLRKQDASGKRETHETVRDEKGDSVIYRKGEVGDWKKHLTVEQSEVVDKLMNEKLKYGIIHVKYEI